MSTVISTKTSGVGGLTVTGDASGVLELASANGTTAVTIDASQNVTFAKGLTVGAATSGTMAPQFNQIYPVGSVYIAVVPTNPATLFGIGTWVAFGAGRVMVGLDATQTEFDVVEEVGGAKTHTLSTGEIPSHGHAFNKNNVSGTAYETLYQGGGGGTMGGITGGTSINQGYSTIGDTGGGGAHNNLQPYIVCYFWKRTA